MLWVSFPSYLPRTFSHCSSFCCNHKLSLCTDSLSSASSCSKTSYLEAPQPHTTLLAPTLLHSQTSRVTSNSSFLYASSPLTTPMRLVLIGHKTISLLLNPRYIFSFFSTSLLQSFLPLGVGSITPWLPPRCSLGFLPVSLAAPSPHACLTSVRMF